MTAGGDSVVCHKAWNKGKPQSEEQKLAHSKRMTGRKHSVEHNLAISYGLCKIGKIYCVELDRVFNSTVEAKNILGLAKTANICSCLHGHRQTAGGYHWQYYKED